MSDWFTEGFEAAEKAAKQNVVNRRSKKNFWTRAGEIAVVRFLTPAKKSLNFKRCYLPYAKGDKYYTSPGVYPDPFVQAGYQLQLSFAWKVLDRRIIEVGEEKKKIGPRILYFADGRRTQQALVNFEHDLREQINEERKEEGKPPFTEEEYNLTSFDIRMKKDKGEPWHFTAIKRGNPQGLLQEDKDLVEKYDFDLKKELTPLPADQIAALLATSQEPTTSNGTEYAYGEDKDDSETTFFDE